MSFGFMYDCYFDFEYDFAKICVKFLGMILIWLLQGFDMVCICILLTFSCDLYYDFSYDFERFD